MRWSAELAGCRGQKMGAPSEGALEECYKTYSSGPGCGRDEQFVASSKVDGGGRGVTHPGDDCWSTFWWMDHFASGRVHQRVEWGTIRWVDDKIMGAPYGSGVQEICALRLPKDPRRGRGD